MYRDCEQSSDIQETWSGYSMLATTATTSDQGRALQSVAYADFEHYDESWLSEQSFFCYALS